MFTKLIRHQLVEKDFKISDLARLLNTSYQNLDQKIKRDNFSEKDLKIKIHFQHWLLYK